MVAPYFAVCIQSDNTATSHRKEIKKANLERNLDLIEYAVTRLGFPEYAPVRLIVFCEYFMQGWAKGPGPYSTVFERFVKDIAIQIPGEETKLLGEVAKKHNLYISGSASEVMPEFPDFHLNCSFIVGPTGEIIYKHHKYCVYLTKGARDAVSPHDVWDKYVEVMDGKYGRKKGDIVSCFFPVVDTDIGRLGTLICNEGHYPEHARALGLQGCEVMLRHSGSVEPKAGPPQEMWEVENRSHAVFNMMYVVACSSGWHYSPSWPRQLSRGYSMIIDHFGALRAVANYPGETLTGAVIDIEDLRRRRTDPKYNWQTQLRTEVYREMYKKPIYPKNLFLDKPVAELDFPARCAAQPVKKWLEEGIFIPPAKLLNESETK